jgi:hypothetical protein
MEDGRPASGRRSGYGLAVRISFVAIALISLIAGGRVPPARILALD